MSKSPYPVEGGQSLADVAAAVYGLRSEWRRIYDANPELAELVLDGASPIPMSVLLTIPAVEPRAIGASSGGGRFRLLVRAEVAHLEGRKLLQADVGQLHGVGAEAGALLAKIGVRSIFDLAQARPFNAVNALLDDGGADAGYGQHGFLPGDLLRGDPRQVPDVDAFLAAGLEEIEFHRDPSERFAEALAEALPARSIRDLALWPPFRAARAIFDGTFNPLAGAAEDPEAPSDLVPRTGNYATERVQYQSVIMTRLAASEATTVELATAGGVQLGAGLVDELGAVGPAEGAIITTEQAWYAQGVTLGQLLHSLALAPGESTRIAMVDWTRRTSARTSSSTTQLESLAQSTVQARSISEITDAIARESQHGASQVRQREGAASRSRSSQVGGGGSVSSAFLSFGGSASRATSDSVGEAFGVATSVSRSSGERRVSAQTAQRVAASTRQHATAARSRRATIVQETFESEQEVATTRVITNYNHMHALSVQYYEVVQAYRVRTQVLDYDRVVFVPMKPMNFNNSSTIERFRSILWRYAPLVEWHPEGATLEAVREAVDALALASDEDRPAREAALQALTATGGATPIQKLIEGWARPTQRSRLSGRDGVIEAARLLRLELLPVDGADVELPGVSLGMRFGDDRVLWQPGAGQERDFALLRLEDLQDIRLIYRAEEWLRGPVRLRLTLAGKVDGQARPEISVDLLLAPPPRDGGPLAPPLASNVLEVLEPFETRFTTIKLPRASVEPQTSDEGLADAIRLWQTRVDDLAASLSPRTPEDEEAVAEVRANLTAELGATTTDRPRDAWLASADEARAELHLVREAAADLLAHTHRLLERHRLALAQVGKPTVTVPVVTVTTDVVPDDNHDRLVQHLSENALVYSQAIWLASDPMELSRAMAHMTYGQERLVPRLDPRPVAVTGNYLGFKWMFRDPAERAAWMQAEGFSLDASNAEDTMVPLPTGGVFAEAVLGRFNAAEKVDLTRFWNWQESPIPIKPSDIGPIQMAQPQAGGPAATDGLAAPVVRLDAPAPLPDPTGLSAVLSALSTAGLFRDMSGLTQTAALAEAATRTAAALAQRANELTGEGARHAAEEATKALEAGMKHQEKMAELALEAAPLIAAPMTGGASLAGLGATKAGGLMNMASKLDAAEAGGGGAGGNAKSAFSGLLGRLGGLVGRR